ncbi:hypothetical protein QQ39_05085 [Pragia fontium]|nr:hypothetical protein QQ39_05085 [Pragia fontium]
MELYVILKSKFVTNAAIGKAFPRKGKPRTAQAVRKWMWAGVPADVEILCHLNPDIPYRNEQIIGLPSCKVKHT